MPHIVQSQATLPLAMSNLRFLYSLAATALDARQAFRQEIARRCFQARCTGGMPRREAYAVLMALVLLFVALCFQVKREQDSDLGPAQVFKELNQRRISAVCRVGTCPWLRCLWSLCHGCGAAFRCYFASLGETSWVNRMGKGP